MNLWDSSTGAPGRAAEPGRGAISRNSDIAIATIPPMKLLFSLLVASAFLVPASGAQTVTVRLSPEASSEPVTGRLLPLLSRTDRFRPGENGTPIFGIDVQEFAPGSDAQFDATSLGHPVRSLVDIPPGEYHAQAYLNVYTTFQRADGHTVQLPMDQGEGQKWRRSPGNLFSKPTLIEIGGEDASNPQLVLDQVIPPIEPPADTAWVKHVRIESKLLTDFWGQPMPIGATVLLPRGYHEEPDRKYPVVYLQGHFSSRAPKGFGSGRAFDKYWKSDAAPKILLVTLQHATPYYDDSYGVNSANMGPYGDAIVTELIPEVESRFRAIGDAASRSLTGWVHRRLDLGGHAGVLPRSFRWMLEFFSRPARLPQLSGGQSDEGQKRLLHRARMGRGWPGRESADTSGNVSYTMEQENLYEEVLGTRYRSGGQWAAWNAVFAPVAEDGYPMPLWDPLTGAIDPEVAKLARGGYDLRHVLEERWATLGPKLEGKLHVYVGRMDNYYLEGGVYRFEKFLEGTDEPHYGGEFGY